MVPHEDKFVYLRYKTRNSPELLNHLPYADESCNYSNSGGHEIIPSDHARDLEILMFPGYTWDLNIIATTTENARDTASWALGVFKDRSAEVMLTLYNALIRSRVEFCSPLWNPLDIGNIQKLEDIQRQFTRRIIGQRNKDYWDRLQSLNLTSLQRRRERYQIIHIWKILNGYAPNDLKIEFTESDRRGIQAKIPQFNKKARKSEVSLLDSSFRIHSSKLWNTLPAKLTRFQNLETFKTHLGRHLDGVPDKPPIRGQTAPNRNSLIDWHGDQSGGWQMAR